MCIKFFSDAIEAKNKKKRFEKKREKSLIFWLRLLYNKNLWKIKKIVRFLMLFFNGQRNSIIA